MSKKRLLLIEDDYDVAEMLLIYFDSQEYEVIHTDTGSAGIYAARTRFPHLILLDLMLPDMDGYDVCVRIRETSFTKFIPIIFLTQRDERANKVRGLELGADDYITKPFDIDELRLRVQKSINRATRESLHEARTGLPTGALVEEEIVRHENADVPAAMICYELEYFEPYKEVYGFMAANEVINFAARILREMVSHYGTANDFVGIVDDRFIVLTHTDSLDVLQVELMKRIELGIKAFYTFQDVERGGLMAKDEGGTEYIVPIMNLMRC